MSEATRFGYTFINEYIEERERAIREYRFKAEEAERGLKPLKEFREELAANICLDCKGYGKIRVWIAQDETRLEPCSRCNGTGRKP